MRNFKPRKLVTLMLPIFGTVSIVGTGFSLWVFNGDNGSSQNEAKLNIEVTSESKIGAFDKKSLKTEGTVADAKAHQIFPSMLVFEEGYGLENDLTEGLNFYKKTLNDPNKPGYDSTLPIFAGLPYLNERVDIIFYLDEILKENTNFSLEASILVTSELSKAISVLDQFQFSHQTIKEEIPDSEDPTKVNLKFTYEFTKLAHVNIDKVLGSTIKDDVIQTENIIDTNYYWKYTYNFNLGSIFRYSSMLYKPTTVDAYKRIVEIIKNENEKLQFTFKAECN